MTKESLRERRDLLLSEIPKNPKALKERALSKAERENLPEDHKALVEKEVEIKGRLDVLRASDEEGRERDTYYELTTKEGQTVSLYFVEEPKALSSKEEVTVRGLALDSLVVAESAEAIEGAIETRPVVTGTQDVLVILHNFSNTTFTTNGALFDDGVTQSAVQAKMTSESTSVSNFYDENSYGNVAISTTVTPMLTSSYSASSGCSTSSISTAARNAATAAGYNVNNYERVIYLYPYISACGWAGLGQVGGPTPSKIWINGYNSSRIIAHELGHNFDLGHANFLDCGAKTVDDYGNCNEIEYGDDYDTMGSGYSHFSAGYKEWVGWLPSRIQTVSGSGTYTINAIENNDSSIKGLKIPKTDTGDFYYLEYRKPVGFDAWLTSGITRGVIGRIGDAVGGDTKLLDFTPGNDESDIALSDGADFIDEDNQIAITQVGHTADTVTLRVWNLLEISNLTISDTTPAIGEAVTASFTMTNSSSSSISVPVIGVATWLNYPNQNPRDFAYQNYDFAPGESKAFSFTKTFTETGSYRGWVTFVYGGKWYNAKASSGPENINFVTHVPDIRATTYITTSPTELISGKEGTYTISLKSYEAADISLDALGIAARRTTDGIKADTAWNPQVIGGNTTLADLTFPITYTKEGTYYAWPSMKIGSGWHNVKVGGYQYFDVKPLRNYLPVTQSLALSNNTPAIGEEVTASFRIKNNTTDLVTFENLGVATRLNGTYNRDFAYKTGASAVALTPGATSDEIQVKKTFTETGSYSAWITYSIGGVWYNALPQTTQVTSKYFSTHVPDIRATTYITTSPQNLISGQAATYKISIKNYEPRAINLDALGIAARRTTDGAKADTAWNPRTINAGATLTDETYAITFTYGGTYYAWPSMKIGSGWYNVKVGGYQYFSVR